jgi:release factor glutamine methyltransferase
VTRVAAQPTTRGELEAEAAATLGSAREAHWIGEEAFLGAGVRTAIVSVAVRSRFAELVARRRAGAPLQYVLGRWSFRTLDLVLDERVLIPRPETEVLVEVALGELSWVASSGSALVVDLGTGSGAIGLAIAAESIELRPALDVRCCDASPGALDVAAANQAALAGRSPAAAAAVRLHRGDWWQALPQSLVGGVQLAVANPPYVSKEEWPDLDPVIRLYEPIEALVAATGTDGTPGLADVCSIIERAPTWLARPGALVVEIAPHQARAAASYATEAGADAVRVERDLAGRDRIIVARWR